MLAWLLLLIFVFASFDWQTHYWPISNNTTYVYIRAVVNQDGSQLQSKQTLWEHFLNKHHIKFIIQ
jgi:hypothetical protein